MKADQLHVVAVFHNPVLWDSRLKLHREFEEHMLDSGVRLTTVELQLGERPFELVPRTGVQRVQLRTYSVLWHKENLLNLAIQRLPEDWKYLAWIDADVHFRNKDWAIDTVQALQQYRVVQPWVHCYDLGPEGEHLQVHTSFAHQWWNGKPIGANHKPYAFAHPGYAWAIRRHVFDGLGCLFDLGILGSGDNHMAMAMVDQVELSIPGNANIHYTDHLKEWERRARIHVNGDIGFIPGTIEHHWHGRKSHRRYVGRWDILIRHDYNPDYDIKKNSQGVYEWTGGKPDLRRDVDRYFRQRNEDANTME